jgi:integrase
VNSYELPIDTPEIWLAALRAAGRSPHTISTYRAAIGLLREWRTADPDLTTLTKLEARAFTAALMGRYQPGGVSSRLRSLSAFYGWLVNEEEIAVSPFRNVSVKVPDKPQPIADEAAITEMLERARKANPRDYALLVLMVDSGCRKGEIAAVSMADVDITSGVITFPKSKSRPRIVPLSDRAVVALGRWLRRRGIGAGGLWSSPKVPITRPYELIRAVVDRHSGGQLTPHTLRRALACRWIDAGGSEVGLQRLAGWADSQMVRRYTAANADRLMHAEYKRLMG